MSHQAVTLDSLPAPRYFKDAGWCYHSVFDATKYDGFSYLPKISVLVPSYNQAEYIEENLRSIVAQNYPNTEIIVVDGGSTDDSLEVIYDYQEYIEYYVSEKDKGTYDADNKALEKSTGDYWIIVNSDDILLPNAFYNFIAYLNNTNTRPDWVTGGVKMLNDSSEVKAKVLPQQPAAVGGYTFGHSCWIYHPCTFLSRKVYNVVGKFKPTDIMDYDYWIRMEQLGYLPVVLPHYLAGLRWHSNCKSFSYLKIIKSVERRIDDLMHEHLQDLKYSAISQFKNRISDWDLEYKLLDLKSNIFEGHRLKATGQLLLLGAFNKQLLTKRSYWGLAKRLLTGITEKEFSPLYFLKSDYTEPQ